MEQPHGFARITRVPGVLLHPDACGTSNPDETYSHDIVSYCYTL